MKKKHIIIAVVLLIGAIALGSSLAWWTWSTSSNEQTNVVVTVGGITIDYEDGENITNNNLIPTSTKEKGISKSITVSSTGQVYLDLNMAVVTLDDGLKDASFKYEIYNGSELVTGGNFGSRNAGDNIALLSVVEVTSTPTTYTLYIWIDGNMSNPNTMYNQNFEFRLNAEATDEKPNFAKQTLQKLGLTVNEGTPNFSHATTRYEGIYKAQDDYGTTYYFRGAAENNYVYFAEYYWRIIRINGDGSIRMIYDGTSAHTNNEEFNNDRFIGYSMFNYTYGDNTYIGYMTGIDNQCTEEYCAGTTNTTSYEQATSNTYNSVIKTFIDSWYETNIEETGYSEYLADVIYCNDRSISSGDGYGENATTYMPSVRKITNNTPVLTCSQKNDAFTVNDTTYGNGMLTYPIGLITSDEAVMAGVTVSSSTETDDRSNYLNSGNMYWTMSPSEFMIDTTYGHNSAIEHVLYTDSLGGTSMYNNNVAVKPVISLKSSVNLLGQGTMDNPYVAQ